MNTKIAKFLIFTVIIAIALMVTTTPIAGHLSATPCLMEAHFGDYYDSPLTGCRLTAITEAEEGLAKKDCIVNGIGANDGSFDCMIAGDYPNNGYTVSFDRYAIRFPVTYAVLLLNHYENRIGEANSEHGAVNEVAMVAYYRSDFDPAFHSVVRLC